ncbi:hypothetical protein SAMN05421780_104297 [Flexibacter flexilis DSM 6793]|uniref:Uncharacterized protein n=1 Tax=Flexibacter flexilis DSM 6793 TaxID=927664 RepID=A0A1I1IAT7_9BACT|nr:hypothetical protein [Flexibacter flexilis]SFC33469.1 hypothetical protein SAMN05421780_104297 [Flexibacter flexilis DSM 6793]
MYTPEELNFLSKERSNQQITGCLTCEYGHSQCTCSQYDEEEDDEEEPCTTWYLLELTNDDGSRTKESLIIVVGTFEECESKFNPGENTILSESEFKYL